MNDFNPNWVSKPGATIKDILLKRNISIEDFALKMEMSTLDVKKLINANIKITNKIAKKLNSVLGPSVEFWINRERFYKKEVKRLNYENHIK